MKKNIVFLTLLTILIFTFQQKVEAGETGNMFTEIRAFQTEEGARLLIRYDYSGVFGAFNLQRAVGPDGTYMPLAPGELVESYFEGSTIVWILDLDNLGRQRTFRVLITP